MRDLLDEPAETWERERRRTAESGWVAELLGHMGPDGEWPKGRWTASTWTLLLLVACGLPEGHPAGRPAIERLLGRFMPAGEDVDGAFLLGRVDLCHLGFWLGLGAHFQADDPRLPPLGRAVLSAQLDDGGWNCHMRNRPATRHGSLHDLQRAREPSNRRRARDRSGACVPRRRDASGRVHALPSHVPLRPHRRGHLGAVRAPHIPVALALHHPARSRLPAPDAWHLRRTPRRPDRRAAGSAEAERTVAAASASPERSSSRWRSPARTVAGTHCAPFGSSGAASRRAEARRPAARLESSHAPRGPGQYRCPACPASRLARATSLARSRHPLRASLLSSAPTA